ncbi:MAG TPA: tetratricopeptide repeat protein [Tepidisphaeraceae bacterium]|nr:tetratricopeptide repeat protein [Tepidisphaeraceae bacterium]
MDKHRRLLEQGNDHLRAGRLQEAISSYRAAIQSKPDFSDAFSQLGIALHQGGHPKEALEAFQKAVDFSPNSASALNNLARALRLAGQARQAVEIYRRSIAVRPGAAHVHANLAVALMDAGQIRAAIDECEIATRLDPKSINAFNTLGNALRGQGLYDRAIAAFERSIALDPASVLPRNNLGNVLRESGRIKQAIETYRDALKIDPRAIRTESNLLATLHFDPTLSQADILSEYSQWNQRHVQPLQGEIQPHSNDRDPNRKLRVGYVSADMRDHPVGHFLLPLLSHHDAERVEVYCYADMARGADGVTARLRKTAHQWRNIADLPDAQTAKIIRDDGIDVLVDLSGHTAGNRMLVFARKPAPVQVTYLGYPNTTGNEKIDYWLSDGFVDPASEDDSQFSEFMVRLPRSFACYARPAGTMKIGELPALVNGYITFGSFNNLAKLNAGVIACWSDILAQVPQSKLLIVAKGLEEPAGADRMREAFARHGIESERLELMGFQSRQNYFLVHNRVDIALDPFPVNGHTTTCNALWMGVPVISLAGTSHCSRLGASVLSNVNLQKFAASDVNQYKQIAISLAKDREQLKELRTNMRRTMLKSPLMNAKQLAGDIELAYRAMWRTWCNSAEPQPSRAFALRKNDFLNEMANFASELADDLRHPEAKMLCEQVLSNDPQHAKAISVIGYLALQQDKVQEAIELLDRALALDPNAPRTSVDKASAMIRLNQYAKAVPVLRKVVASNPNYALAYTWLGLALNRSGELEPAIHAFDRSVELGADDLFNQLTLAWACLRCQLYERAESAARRANSLRPNLAQAYLLLGQSLSGQSDNSRALSAFRQAMSLQPRWELPWRNLLYSMLFLPEFDASAIYREHEKWYETFAAPLRQAITPHENDPNPQKRLKIGYVSSNLRDHVIGFNMLPIFKHHDRRNFEIYCYVDFAGEDPIVRQFRTLADHWTQANGLTTGQLSEKIRADQIDILVDLTLHLSNSRLSTFAQKPAPVQVTFAGYPGTTGLKTIDYRLTDPYLDPPGMNDAFYSEESIRLPDSFWCYEAIEDESVSPLPADAGGHVTFGCLNNFNKVNDLVLGMWSEVFKAVPSAKFILHAPEGRARQHVIERLGMDPARIEFLSRQNHREYTRTYHRIDIGLDTFPYNGHTTSLDSIWMGVPVVSLMGKTVVSRAGFSQATNIGLTELVANSPREFVKIAVDLANDLPRLRNLRQTLRQKMKDSPIMNISEFTVNLENAYRAMWRRWCESKQTSTIR